MLSERDPKTKLKVIRLNDPEASIMMHIAFSESETPKYMKLSLCLALYFTLALLWMPGFKWSKRIYTVDEKSEPRKIHRVLKPPVDIPLQKVVIKNKIARKVPMPDRTPNEPEPEVTYEPVRAPEMVETEDWEIGLPEGIPIREKVAVAGEQGVDSPIFTKKVAPNYPFEGVQARLQGYVILQAILRKTGVVENIEVLRRLGKGEFGFEEEAIFALKQWEFIAGQLDGAPADVRMKLRIDFIIQ